MRRFAVAFLAATFVTSFVHGQDGPKKGSYGPAQAMADLIRGATGAEIALIPAMMIRGDVEGNNLARLVSYPGDPLVVSELTGAQIRAALNRSVSLYPSPNNGFLQISGLEVSFNPGLAAGSRITSVVVNGSALVDDRVYRVGMPVSLGKGNYGYLNIWDKKAIKKTFDNLTLEQALEGKTGDARESRWKIVG